MSWFNLKTLASAAKTSGNEPNETNSSTRCLLMSDDDHENKVNENNATDVEMPANHQNDNNDLSCSLIEHVSRAYLLNFMKLNEINSADDVRRRMHAVLSSRQHCNNSGSIKITDLNCNDTCSQTGSHVTSKTREAHAQTRGDVVTIDDCNNARKIDKAVGKGAFAKGDGRSGLSNVARPMTSSLKRKRGRPPKAGPSKKNKIESRASSKDSFYFGKLSNVCFRHQAGDF